MLLKALSPVPPQACEAGATFLSLRPEPTGYLARRLLECWVPRWAGLEQKATDGGKATGKDASDVIQMWNTDLEARVLSREEAGKEGTGVLTEGPWPVISGCMCVFVSGLPVWLCYESPWAWSGRLIPEPQERRLHQQAVQLLWTPVLGRPVRGHAEMEFLRGRIIPNLEWVTGGRWGWASLKASPWAPSSSDDSHPVSLWAWRTHSPRHPGPWSFSDWVPITTAFQQMLILLWQPWWHDLSPEHDQGPRSYSLAPFLLFILSFPLAEDHCVGFLDLPGTKASGKLWGAGHRSRAQRQPELPSPGAVAYMALSWVGLSHAGSTFPAYSHPSVFQVTQNIISLAPEVILDWMSKDIFWIGPESKYLGLVNAKVFILTAQVCFCSMDAAVNNYSDTDNELGCIPRKLCRQWNLSVMNYCYFDY